MFKADFKYYKSRNRSPDLLAVVNVNENFAQHKLIIPAADTEGSTLFSRSLGLKPVVEWRICELSTTPGLIYITNPFTTVGQRYWVSRCLRDYTRKPNRLNIDAHGYVEQGDSWWEACHRNVEVNERLLKKLRWATLGYHHNWDTKVYSEDSHDEFPLDLKSLSGFVARVAGFENFTAEAAIVNFYHMDSTLSGHTDHSEANLEAPLLSFSFGQSAIFLIGGPTIDEKPSAILLESGDVIMMSGQSRLCYHGVPRILPAKTMPWLSEYISSYPQVERYKSGGALEDSDVPVNSCELGVDTTHVSKCLDETFWTPYSDYLRTSRINMNVRQVLLPGHSHV